MATAQTNKNVLQRAFDALNDQDRATFIDLHATDVVAHAGDESIHGIDDLVTEEFAYFDVFPDLTYTLDETVAEGDTVAALWTFTGTHEGKFHGIDPTRAKVEISVMGMFRIEEERVVEVWILSDQLGLMQQFGVVEPLRE